MNRQAANFIGAVPGNYDKHLGPRIFQGYAEDLARRIARTRPAKALELAAGTGILSRCLRNVLPDSCELLATDLNQPMLEVAGKKFTDGDRVRFELADATRLPMEDNSFDAVACQFGVMFFPDREKSYAEVARVLVPGGHYVFNVWGSLQGNPFANIANRTVEELFPENPPGFYQVPFSYHDAESIETSLRNAGFTETRSELLQITTTAEPHEDFARGLVFGNPLEEEILDRGADPQAVHAAITRALKRDLPEPMPLQALVIEARLGG
ncbi:class I SAM-dependent methyltransferase [Pseudohalioglobus lutimaris]|uniref:Ubiquinone biosynthesis protein UbiE n=1 Tax=Pseudohalioglobus lutimaris TaxID=1737061 RepID=A0A2N5X810_9GAMM|nr:methyltransferase domain-containing protein [Pseudohalioglobus lutimaris]PLW70624.1 ubiquinone biosynthesis protein UbiE [Pseudohalioglobus lutimaris]